MITYRLNRGDIQSIREVWMDGGYTLPFDIDPGIMVDLGANIGLTSVWLARRYGFSRIVAVEPLASNAHLARINLDANGIEADVVKAAVGPRDGMAMFEESAHSNLGRLGTKGTEVPMVSMPTLQQRLPPGTRISLLKIDIEGAEEALFAGDVGWLDRIDSIIIELHPSEEACDRTIRRLVRRGFRFLPSGAAHPGSMTAFIR